MTRPIRPTKINFDNEKEMQEFLDYANRIGRTNSRWISKRLENHKPAAPRFMGNVYIKNVVGHLIEFGYSPQGAEDIISKYHDVMKEIWGYEPNSYDFAKEIDRIDKLGKRVIILDCKNGEVIIDPEDPEQAKWFEGFKIEEW